LKSLLFLSHRIPYPPDKGDKIRSYNIVRAFTSGFRVHLGTFADAPEDMAYVENLERMGCRVYCRPLSPRLATFKSAGGLLTGTALTLPYYSDRELRRWVDATLDDHSIDAAYIFSSAMGQYCEDRRVPFTVVDFCDVDSDKWSQYAAAKPWPLSSIYRREARRLSKYEQALATSHDKALFVSDAERMLFVDRYPELRPKAMTVRNGVDTIYFDPGRAARLAGPQSPIVVFTGAMDYWANVDAVCWFVTDAWPSIRRRHRRARFLIVGARPTAAVLKLARQDGVEVVGRVEDVRPYLASARVAVAPMRIARGLQNKILEALAMARHVVATPAALSGLDSVQVPGVWCARDATELADAISETLGSGPADNPAGREYVVEKFGWNAVLEPLMALIERSISANGSR